MAARVITMPVVAPKTNIYEVECEEEPDLPKPEKALLRAFLDRMVKDALGLSVDVQRHYCRAARQWLLDAETDEPFSLVWTCNALEKPVESFLKFARELNALSKDEAKRFVLSKLDAATFSLRGTSPLNTCRLAQRRARRRRQLARLQAMRARR